MVGDIRYYWFMSIFDNIGSNNKSADYALDYDVDAQSAQTWSRLSKQDKLKRIFKAIDKKNGERPFRSTDVEKKNIEIKRNPITRIRLKTVSKV